MDKGQSEPERPNICFFTVYSTAWNLVLKSLHLKTALAFPSVQKDFSVLCYKNENTGLESEAVSCQYWHSVSWLDVSS